MNVYLIDTDYSCKTLQCLVGLKRRDDTTWEGAAGGIGRLGIDPPTSSSSTANGDDETPNLDDYNRSNRGTRVPKPEPTPRAGLGMNVGGGWLGLGLAVLSAMAIGMLGVFWLKKDGAPLAKLHPPFVETAQPKLNGHA